MITKCRPIEIIRKKFSDFENYEKNENEVYLVGYEVDKDGNRKNVKINAKSLNIGENVPSSPKSLLINEITNAPGKGYTVSIDSLYDNHYCIKFDVDVADFFQIEKIDPSIIVKENCEEYGLILDIRGSLENSIGKTTRIIMYDVCPENYDGVNILYGDYIIGEVHYGQTLIVDIFHTFHSEIVIARAEDIEIVR